MELSVLLDTYNLPTLNDLTLNELRFARYIGITSPAMA